jgi:hypothetical protein
VAVAANLMVPPSRQTRNRPGSVTRKDAGAAEFVEIEWSTGEEAVKVRNVFGSEEHAGRD